MPLFDLRLSGFTTEQDRAYCQGLVDQRLRYAVTALAVGVGLALLIAWYLRRHHVENVAAPDQEAMQS
jgi:NADH:ubiquinone oxidoreductase subunit K